MDKTINLEAELERLVDATSLGDVLLALADVAHAKEDHLAAAWQDHASARTWHRLGGRIDTAARAALEAGI